MEIGAQLYTVRKQCQTLEDFSASLRRVADIGYRNVQVSGVCAYEPQWLQEQLKRNGLHCVLTHTPSARLLADPDLVAREHAVFGCRCVGLGYYAFKAEEGQTVARFAQEYGPVARGLRQAGAYFMYHNHDQEFRREDGRLILDRLAEAFAPEDMGFTLDTFWVQAGGGDPAQWVERLAGRVPCIHLKDYAYGRKMAVIGEGNINFARVFAKAEQAGTQFMLVEQDDCNGEDPFDCLRRSYDQLHAWGFQ